MSENSDVPIPEPAPKYKYSYAFGGDEEAERVTDLFPPGKLVDTRLIDSLVGAIEQQFPEDKRRHTIAQYIISMATQGVDVAGGAENVAYAISPKDMVSASEPPTREQKGILQRLFQRREKQGKESSPPNYASLDEVKGNGFVYALAGVSASLEGEERGGFVNILSDQLREHIGNAGGEDKVRLQGIHEEITTAILHGKSRWE
ncbi:hypothetical protein IPM62_01430 [Candidatus Woesebacteria bacterium]|nr:MAG: hypothetical protein IPM62_01430 [Candidatus Woesebacteria bacterium]